mgnify:CR=1 FL=1
MSNLEEELREALLAPHGEYLHIMGLLGREPIDWPEAKLIAHALAPVAAKWAADQRRPDKWHEGMRERESDGWF